MFSEIQHLFYSKENDWGYSHFIAWNVSTREIIENIKKWVVECFSLYFGM